ncbi:MAG TPA: PAS domain-containing protein [Gammaproteobacteria bacterium]|nr:PAS domain-containing protein [Gammaproteobacteria bacterium]
MRNHDTFYNLIANAPLGIYVVDGQFRLREISAGCRKLFSNVRPLLGRDFAEVLRIVWTEPFASEAIALFRHTLKTGEPYHSPDTTEQRGDIMDVESYDWQIRRVALPDGQFGVVCYFFDMTERVRSQRLLAEQKQLLEMVASNRSLRECLNNLTDSVTRLHPAVRAGVLIPTADRGRVAEVYAARFSPVFSASIRNAELSGACGMAIRIGKPYTSSDVKHDRDWTPDWRELGLQHGILAEHSIPILDADGNAIASFFLTLGEARRPDEWELRIAEFGAHIASIALDRDRRMNTLREQHQRLSGMLGSITDALAFVDTQWRITFINDAGVARTGRSHEELLGRSVWELFPDGLDSEAAIQAKRAMAERISTRYEMYYKPFGKWVMGSIYPTADGGLAIYSQDITERKRLEERAQQLAQRLQLLTDAMPALISYIDSDGRFRFNNRTYQDWFGYKPEEVLGRRMDEVLGEAAYENLRPYVETALAGKRVRFEADIPYKKAGVRSVMGEYMPDFRPDGSVAGFYVLVHDITERRRAEKALHESREQYRALFESIDEGFCIIQMMFDERGRAVDWRFLQTNPAFERESGLQGVRDKTMREIIPAAEAVWFEKFGRVALTREPLRFEEHAKNLQRWFSVFAFPVNAPGSGEVGLLFSNITERKHAEQAIRYHSEETESLLNAAPLGVYLVDAGLKIREMNPIARDVFGDIPGGVVGRSFDEIKHILWEQEYADEIVRIFRHTLETGEPYVKTEMAERRIDRNVTEYYEWRLDRITLPDGRHGVVCYFRDIAQQVQARREIERSRDALRETDRRKDEFLAMLAHELRNPLTPIRNAAQILKFPGIDDKSRAAASAMLDRQVNQMVRLVDDLLDVSRITRGKIELRKQRIELATSLNDAVETVRPICEHRKHTLTVTLPPEPVYLDADPARLVQVVGNLLNNAYKFTMPGGHILLTAEAEGAAVVIRVRDDGIGIAADQLPRIFEMFTQVDSSLERVHSGLGIGLTLVKNLVEMHGGTVEVRSAGIGKGSEFSVRLPRIAADSRSESRKSAALKQETTVPRRILLVDDNRDLTDSLASLLQMTGHEVHVASDGLEAVTAAARLHPDVILLDIGLPKLNGYEAARKIREHEKDGHTVLVAVTGWGQEADRRRSEEAGFNAHMVKPLDFDALSALLARLDGPSNKSFQQLFH